MHSLQQKGVLMSGRIPLTVSPKMASKALRFGAVQNEEQWWIPPGVDPYPFWSMLRGGNINLRSRRFWRLQTEALCIPCGEMSKVIALVVPPGHEVLLEDEEDEKPAKDWIVREHFSILETIHYLLPTAFDAIYKDSYWFYPKPMAVRKSILYLNFCQFCHSDFPEAELFGEPGSGFMAIDPDDSEKFTVDEFEVPLMASVSAFSEEVPWLEYRLIR